MSTVNAPVGQALMEDPEIRKLTSTQNSALLNRRAYAPPVCPVFAKPFTRIAASDEFKFTIDREAARREGSKPFWRA